MRTVDRYSSVLLRHRLALRRSTLNIRQPRDYAALLNAVIDLPQMRRSGQTAGHGVLAAASVSRRTVHDG